MNSEITFSICRLNSLVNSPALMVLKGEAGVTTALLGTEICLELLPCVSSGKVPPCQAQGMLQKMGSASTQVPFPAQGEE